MHGEVTTKKAAAQNTALPQIGEIKAPHTTEEAHQDTEATDTTQRPETKDTQWDNQAQGEKHHQDTTGVQEEPPH